MRPLAVFGLVVLLSGCTAPADDSDEPVRPYDPIKLWFINEVACSVPFRADVALSWAHSTTLPDMSSGAEEFEVSSRSSALRLNVSVDPEVVVGRVDLDLVAPNGTVIWSRSLGFYGSAGNDARDGIFVHPPAGKYVLRWQAFGSVGEHRLEASNMICDGHGGTANEVLQAARREQENQTAPTR